MNQEYMLRCSLCGTTHEADATSAEQLQTAKEGNTTYICGLCERKVQYESDQKFR
ncbi:DUF2197 domain-containing protein [Tumebacillus algifaecis]|uniref:DUF2197 domain-containing protein n=1 Tax=Tumebacillus algifaecis TaxID=1214604 RepID=UPI0012FD157B|nr:DUF2197 domain-containing protein [Tumebacillus algifaecis]